MNPETTTTLSAITTNLKLIARNALRMKLISPRLSRIGMIEENIKDLNKAINEHDHEILVQTYEISKMDQQHPDHADHKNRKEDDIKELTECINDLKKEIELSNEALKDENEGIAKIESGETKVSLESLNEMVEKLILQRAKNDIIT